MLDLRGTQSERNQQKLKYYGLNSTSSTSRKMSYTARGRILQVVATKPLRYKIFKACHHHAMAAHQGIVRTAALIKRHLTDQECRKTSRHDVKDAQSADAEKPLYEAMVNYNPDMELSMSESLSAVLDLYIGQNAGMSIFSCCMTTLLNGVKALPYPPKRRWWWQTS